MELSLFLCGQVRAGRRRGARIRLDGRRNPSDGRHVCLDGRPVCVYPLDGRPLCVHPFDGRAVCVQVRAGRCRGARGASAPLRACEWEPGHFGGGGAAVPALPRSTPQGLRELQQTRLRKQQTHGA